jgi:hypothetical protein
MINTLARDPKTQAVVNTDVAALNKYKQERALYKKVNALAKELEEMKICLLNVCDRLDRIESK